MKIDMFQILPDDVLGEIWGYMSSKQKKLVNKGKNYLKKVTIQNLIAILFMILFSDFTVMLLENLFLVLLNG